jgi:predicted metalloprotease with PDZ domain
MNTALEGVIIEDSKKDSLDSKSTLQPMEISNKDSVETTTSVKSVNLKETEDGQGDLNLELTHDNVSMLLSPERKESYERMIFKEKYTYRNFKGSRYSDFDLELFINDERQKHVLVRKSAEESLGFMITETGRTSLLPCIFISHIFPGGAAARSGELFVGDQILFVNNVSLVGLPFNRILEVFKCFRNDTQIEFCVIPMPPVDSVVICRSESANHKLGFDVLHGEIISVDVGSASHKAGLKPGHRITEINGQSVVGASHQEIVKCLQEEVVNLKTMPRDLYETLVCPRD